MKYNVTKWHFIRHAPVIGASSVVYQTADEPADVSNSLAFAGLAQGLPKDAIWLVSPLKRAQATAQAIREQGLEPKHWIDEAGLEEQHFGDWHGMAVDDIRKDVSEHQPHKFWFAPATLRPSKGESFVDVMARVKMVLEERTKEYEGENIVAVCHGGVIRAALALALNLDPEVALGISVENLSRSRIDHLPGPGLGGDWRCVYLNARPT
ncbi:MAG: histidine phosphatase family protein [Sphingomonadales bacterium]